MKEAFGGTWIMGFVVLFIVLFSAYLAVSVNYTRAFKVKNKIVNIIEENQGFNSKTKERISEYLKESGYNTTQIDSSRCTKENQTYQKGGYCISSVPANNGMYWKVTSFIKFEIPIMGINITIPIRGETKVLYYYINE